MLLMIACRSIWVMDDDGSSINFRISTTELMFFTENNVDIFYLGWDLFNALPERAAALN
jgi:hypothetical protein